MTHVELIVGDGSFALHPRKLRGHERLGEATAIDVEVFSPTAVDPRAVVGAECTLLLRGSHGERQIRGVAARFASIAVSAAADGRRYRLELRSALAIAALRRRTRVFQKLSVPDIVQAVLKDAGYKAANLVAALIEDHAPREYVVQYAETDAAFVRRLCEEEGLYFRSEPGDDGERFVLEDDSSTAAPALPDPLLLVDGSSLGAPGPIAFSWRRAHRMRPGKVTLRDYNPSKPAVVLEAVKSAGQPIEQSIEVYEAPGRFSDPSRGGSRATRRLESLRADAERCFFESSAFALAPGLAVKLELAASDDGALRPEGDFFIVGTRHEWDGARYTFEVETIPLAAKYRLPKTTPRPRVLGVHHAMMTTAPGEEVHVDSEGRVRVHFPWDCEGPTNDKSSLPIRVMQPNTPGSMLIPRGGWEVLVAFEDGDPDRPYVVGRAFNSKAPPPYSLPGNKTLTSLGTVSSPGGGKENRININDAAGSQNLAFLAGFGKATSVGNNMMVQTAKNEDQTITSSQVSVVGAKQAVSVTQAYLNTLGSQSATVGGLQKIFVKGDYSTGVGPETVVVGAACLEKVGNPVSGLKNLGKAAALQGASAIGIPVDRIMQGKEILDAGIRGYQQGGFQGALGGVGGAAAGQAVGALASQVPGGDLMLGALGGGGVAPWVESQINPGASASGGGASSGSDAAAAKGPGPGHRNTVVAGAYTELIGGACGATSPGSVGWTTIGPSTFLVGGSHLIKASTAGSRTLGISTEVLGSLNIKAKTTIQREIKGLLATTISGTLTSTAKGGHSIKAGAALSIKIGGALTMEGSTIAFICGGSKVVASPGGVIVESSSITITKHTKQSGIHHK
jgi:type VI secretion system secreted protein VgrG